MRELQNEELSQVSGGEFRLDPVHGAALELAIGTAVFTLNPLLAGAAFLSAVYLFGSVEDVNAIREARERAGGGGSGGGAGGSGGGGGLGAGFPNRTGGSRIKSS